MRKNARVISFVVRSDVCSAAAAGQELLQGSPGAPGALRGAEPLRWKRAVGAGRWGRLVAGPCGAGQLGKPCRNELKTPIEKHFSFKVCTR